MQATAPHKMDEICHIPKQPWATIQSALRKKVLQKPKSPVKKENTPSSNENKPGQTAIPHCMQFQIHLHCMIQKVHQDQQICSIATVLGRGLTQQTTVHPSQMTMEYVHQSPSDSEEH